MNLPLYSLILYVIIPKICCSQVHYKPSNLTMKVSKEIHELLELDTYNIFLADVNKSLFVECFAKKSDVVIFTGKAKNAELIKKQLSETTLFIFFGAAQNPIVVTEHSDLEKASNVIYESIIFNYGQDCSKPNSMLIHFSVAKQLVDMMFKKITEESNSRKTTIRDHRELVRTGQMLADNNESILFGGTIDYSNLTMDPVLLLIPIDKNNKYMYEEYYAPVFKFLLYDSDEDLKCYFENDKYKQQAMTITLFGHNNYIESLKNSIIVYEKTISEIDNGNIEFGGFGSNVSSLEYQGFNISKPILINREILFFFNNNMILKNINKKYKARKRKRELIISLFKEKVSEIFGDNLVVSFIFGAYAKFKERSTSDIDIFILIRENNEKQKIEFITWYFEIHYMFGLIPDVLFPSEILTVEELENILYNSHDVKLELYNDLDVYNTVFYVQIMLDKKIYLFGNEDDLKIEKSQLQQTAINWCKQTASSLKEHRPDIYNKYYDKFIFFQPQDDLLSISNMLHYQMPSCKKYYPIIEKLDDGLFLEIVSNQY